MAAADRHKYLDRLAATPDIAANSVNHSNLPRSLMVRIFWLSDGPTNPDAQLAEEFLPESVLTALRRVGIKDPHIVLQSNTSIALGEEDESQFKVDDLPAIVFRERLLFKARGDIRAAGGDQLRLRMEAYTVRMVDKQIFQENKISGSMIAPLEHFVVLSTANYSSSYPDKDGTLSSSRIAFVVQIVESQSFAPEQ